MASPPNRLDGSENTTYHVSSTVSLEENHSVPTSITIRFSHTQSLKFAVAANCERGGSIVGNETIRVERDNFLHMGPAMVSWKINDLSSLNMSVIPKGMRVALAIEVMQLVLKQSTFNSSKKFKP